MIIGIAGTLGSGKGTVVDYLKTKGFAHYSASGRLKTILDERSLPATRENLSTLADELSQEYTGGVLHVSHEAAKKDGVSNYILEAIHRESEAAYVRSIGGIILGVDADPKARYERAVKRQEGEKDQVTFEEFRNDIEREEEGKGSGTPHIRAVIEAADQTVFNDGSLEELYVQIDTALQKI